MRIKDIKTDKPHRVIISGGGTGGHFYPAIAIAEELRATHGDKVEILFVGAYGKMEMTKVPPLGWNIIGLHIAGFQRSLSLKNLALPFKLIHSYLKSYFIVRKFKPQVAIGFGGYVSLPIISCAERMKVATMIWEGNSYPGLANRRLARGAERIFVPHKKMRYFFDESKMIVSGSPLRGKLEDTKNNSEKREEAYKYFGLDSSKPTLFITGGSLGTRVFNAAVTANLKRIEESNSINIIWQSGTAGYQKIIDEIGTKLPANVWLNAFVDRMDLAYTIADLVISRAGASTLAELALSGNAAIIVPSSHVADNHQMKNALTYYEKKAALIMEDDVALKELIPLALATLQDKEKLESMRENVKQFAEPHSAEIIVNEINEFL